MSKKEKQLFIGENATKIWSICPYCGQLFYSDPDTEKYSTWVIKGECYHCGAPLDGVESARKSLLVIQKMIRGEIEIKE